MSVRVYEAGREPWAEGQRPWMLPLFSHVALAKSLDCSELPVPPSALCSLSRRIVMYVHQHCLALRKLVAVSTESRHKREKIISELGNRLKVFFYKLNCSIHERIF